MGWCYGVHGKWRRSWPVVLRSWLQGVPQPHVSAPLAGLDEAIQPGLGFSKLWPFALEQLVEELF